MSKTTSRDPGLGALGGKGLDVDRASCSPSSLVAVSEPDREGVQRQQHGEQNDNRRRGEQAWNSVLGLLSPVEDLNGKRGERPEQ